MYIHLQSDTVVACGCVMAVDCVVEVDVVIDTDPPDVILCTDPSVVVIMEVNKNLFWYGLGSHVKKKTHYFYENVYLINKLDSAFRLSNWSAIYNTTPILIS